MISIVTPFHNCPELIPEYARACYGSQVVAVDNGSDAETAVQLREMMDWQLNKSIYIRNETNEKYSHANNQGLKVAEGEIVVFLNSDIVAKGYWLSIVEKVTKPGALYAASAGMRTVAGNQLAYLEGWCLWGCKSDFVKIGGWNDKDFPGLYWEDNELSFRAKKAGLDLMQVDVPLTHLSNYTSQRTPDAYNHSAENQAVFERIVREGLAR